MSQNPPRGPYDNDFLNENVDLEIAHPSPNAEIYTRTSSSRLPPAPLLVAGFAFLPYLRVGCISMPISKGCRKASAVCRRSYWPKATPSKFRQKNCPKAKLKSRAH